MNAAIEKHPQPETDPRYTLEPRDESLSLPATCEALLKKPGVFFSDESSKGAAGVAFRLLLITIVSLGVFSLVVGLFSGGPQTWATPAKVVGGTLLLGLMTLPSLYVFYCLAGHRISLRLVVIQQLSAMALTSLLLVGMTPILWIFSQSSESIKFFGSLVFLSWALALGFGVLHIIKSAHMLGVRNFFFPGLWLILYLLISLQMTTSLRPIVGSSETFFPKEKKTFLQHWRENLVEEDW